MYGNAGAQIVGVFRFSLASYAGVAEARSAILRLYTTSVKDSGSAFTVYRASSDDWDETTVTWNNAPAKGEAIASVDVTAASQWFEWDVSEYTAEMINAGGAALTFWVEDSSITQQRFECESRRDGKPNPPELVVTTSTIAVGEPVSAGGAEENCDWVDNDEPEPALPPSKTSAATLPCATQPCTLFRDW